MPDVDGDMRGLDALLRQAADGGASRAGPADFDQLVRRDRDRRRARSAVAGAAALVLCVSVGVAAVAGLPETPAPIAPAAPVTLPYVVAPLVDLDAAAEDPVLEPLITDVAVLVWTPDPGSTVEEVRGSAGYTTFLEGNGFKSGQQPRLNDVEDLQSLFPGADTSCPAILTADSLTLSSLEQAAVRLSGVPGVGEARVDVLRGMWFRATVEMELDPGREGAQPGPVIGMTGIQGGDSRTSPGTGGKVRHTTSVTYVGGGVDRAGLDAIKTELARPWGVPGATVSLTANEIRPE